jgi:hypothetical protein
MKIRTDFVTNSSSSSFVTYTITPGDDLEKFNQLFLLIKRFEKKYLQNYIANTYGVSGGVKCYSNREINVTMWTPGLSVSYIDQFFGSDEEMEQREIDFEEFARCDGSYPPDVDIAIAVMFGPNGNEYCTLSGLDLRSSLIDKDGNISRDIDTFLTDKELFRLNELVKYVEVDKKEHVGGTD